MLLISELFARLVDQGFVLSELGVVFVGFVDPSKPALVARDHTFDVSFRSTNVVLIPSFLRCVPFLSKGFLLSIPPSEE